MYLDELTSFRPCLRKLKRLDEADALIEQAVEKHPKNHRILLSASASYANLPIYGMIIAGQFKRSINNGGGYVLVHERDRIRRIQLCLQALKHLPKQETERDTNYEYSIYTALQSAITYDRLHSGSWRLQELSDLSTLPDYKKSTRWHHGGRNPQGAPVDADGKPLYYSEPSSWDKAKNDGERWRFCLAKCIKLHPPSADSLLESRADFLRNQFGVHTMRNFSWFHTLDTGKQKGILQLHTLSNQETLAKLATGVQRFELPDDQNFIQIYQKLSTKRESSADRLIQIYLDRRQHERAAVLLQKTIERFHKSHSKKNRQNLLKQIIGDWGKFEVTNKAFPNGKEPSLSYVFRNAQSVTLVVHEVNTQLLVDDMWEYLEGNPLKIDWQKVRWHNLGHDLVNEKRKKYVGKEVGRRRHELKPNKHHWDTQSTLSIPTKKAGAYLVSAELEEGVTSHTLVWVDGATIIQKNVNGGQLYYVADAVTGKAIGGSNIEFFGYLQQRRDQKKLLRQYDVLTKRVIRKAGEDGTVFIKNDELDRNYQWMVRAKTDRGTTLLGFTRIYSSISHHSGINQTKAFGITDRPVYQPAQDVFGKFWIRHTSYELADISTFAGKKFNISITDPAGNSVLKNHSVTADAYGGVEYTYKLPEDTKLGVYSVTLRQGSSHRGSHSFRVEEYKKPEYEVLVDAPKEPVMLGDKFEATVKANYYHGAPVTKATVKVKVMRTRHNDRWFPNSRWDWLYGGGYGWLDIERPWYPGWNSWGCRCPIPLWWNRGGEQPEIVLEQELEIGADGTVKIAIDTALAKAVHSDTDHQYTVTAEVVDASRRTIVGTGNIIAARQAYQVSVWLDRGYASVGDAIIATTATRSADGKHVDTKGKATLYRTSIKDGKVTEIEIQSWKINTENDRNSSLKFKAGSAGQYRLACKMTDVNGREIEGAILFTVRGDQAADGDFHYSDIELIADKRTYKNGSTVKLLINTKQPNSTVILTMRNTDPYQRTDR